MRIAAETRTGSPKFNLGCPEWWHHHGNKTRVTVDNSNTVTIAGSAAEITIVAVNGNAPNTTDFSVEWKVILTQGQMATGTRIFGYEELAAAFGITNDSGDHGQWLIDRYGGQSAEQGLLYIRWRNFLNVPCPGTGLDGDPNISILITDEIKSAILDMLLAAKNRAKHEAVSTAS